MYDTTSIRKVLNSFQMFLSEMVSLYVVRTNRILSKLLSEIAAPKDIKRQKFQLFKLLVANQG